MRNWAWWLLWGTFVVIIGTLWLINLPYAYGQTKGEWFESLKMPNSNASCCDVSDCKQVEAEWRDGQWWAFVVDRWQAIPEGVILKKPLSFDGEAYACAWQGWVPDDPKATRRVYCFVPPILGAAYPR